MSNRHNDFSDIENLTVTITAKEMAEIIMEVQPDLNAVLAGKTDLEEIVFNMMIIDLLNKFGAAIMAEMFGNDQHIEIDYSDHPEK